MYFFNFIMVKKGAPYYGRKARRTVKKWAPTVAKYGPTGLALAKAVIPYLPFNAEYKLHEVTDTALDLSTDPNTTGQCVSLCTPVQGLTQSTRIGSSIRATSIYIRGQIKCNASATQTFVRVALVRDTKCGGVLPDMDAAVWNSNSMVSMRNIQFGSRFKVMYDRVFGFGATGTDTTRFFKIYKKLSRRAGKLEFDGNAGTVADLSSQNYILCMWSTEATNVPTVTYHSRVRYLDN